MHQFIYNRRNCHDFFFCDTRQVIVKGTSIYNILCCLADIRCLIHQCRRITCTGSDSSLTGRENCGNNARSACSGNQRDIFMFHHNVAGLKCRILNCTCNIIRSACFQRCLIQQIYRENRCLDRSRMRIEYYCITSCQHSHGITQHSFTWVCTRSDRSDNTKWSHLNQSKSSVTRPCCCCNIFRSRCLLSHQTVFQDFVSYISHSGFFHTHTCKSFCILADFFTNSGNDFFSLIHGHLTDNFLGLFCSLDGFVHILENAMFSGRRFLNLHLSQHFLHDILYHTFIYRHENYLPFLLQPLRLFLISSQAVP